MPWSGPAPARAQGEAPLVITGEATWSGVVELREDVLVTEDGHLNVAPGTRVLVHPSEGTRTDPQYYSTETEIVVRGRLTVSGTEGKKVAFSPAAPGGIWAGIIADGAGASVSLSRTSIEGAQAGVTLIDARGDLEASEVSRCEYGLVLLGKASAAVRGSRLQGNAYGLADYSGGARLEDTTVAANTEKDLLDASRLAGYKPPAWRRPEYRLRPSPGETEYLGDHSIAADAVWSGRVVIRGQVAVQPGATLTVSPGTEVAFRKLDTNGDGLGESQLLVLGRLKVLGSPENWVLFTSAEQVKRPGDWDKVSLIASDAPDNEVRFARFEYGYQAFHNHFSAAALRQVIFADNYRGVQFQESPDTLIEGAWLTGNRSAMRFRDSRVRLVGVLLEGNVTGVNFLRCRSSISDSVITGSLMDPLLGRESETSLSGVLLYANREGPRFKGEGSRLTLEASAVSHNLEDGLSLADTEVLIRSSEISGNGLDGLSVTGGKVKVERANIHGNGRWAVDNNGTTAVEAPSVWWGTSDPGAVPALVWDRGDDPSLGPVLVQEPLAEPAGLFFIGLEPRGEAWGGDVLVMGDFAWPAGRPLALTPGARVLFRPLPDGSPMDTFRDHPHFPGSELMASGSKVLAEGTKERPVGFLPAGPGEGLSRWAVDIEKSPEARFAWCSFAGAETALHLRESAGSVEHCLFEGNQVGLRFHTSRLQVRDNVFSGNRFGLRFHFGEPDIRGNLFRGNATAIFISDDPGKFSLTGNSFGESRDYDLSLGEPVAADVPAAGNWWGTADPARIAARLFDGRRDGQLGHVVFEPFAREPLPTPEAPAPAKP